MSTSSNPGREKEIFEHAAELTSAEARRAYLREACSDNAELLSRVETLLRAHEVVDVFLPDRPGLAAPESAEIPPQDEPAGSRVGRYKLLQKIGEGGCGTVYMAEQDEPVRRRVALKVIKLGMDTKAVIARFEAERQALALMDHPNIAKVFDAGATDAGRPFFVMELVRGIPITKYCDENNLSTRQRLALFSAVCHAIQHAHQKGIIHRDIKPSNVLVTMHDGLPVPKVIDFGIAKATHGRLTERTMFTAFEQFMGTPTYMSPEQAEMSGLDIDTRSDIYSLGVLLYELLAGRLPFDPKSFVEAGIDEVRRMIREVEPPRPSQRLSTLTDGDRTTVAKLRGTAPAQLTAVLSGDLDWIVMRCLEKNRTRRYGTPSELAADIQRHLQSEPVVARPPTRAYRLGKWVRRHRTAAATTAVVALALVSGTAVATWQAVRATTAEQLAHKEARKSEKVAQALASVFSEIGPHVMRGEDTRIFRAMVDESMQRLPKELESEPAVLAWITGVFADVYNQLLDPAKAREMAARRLELLRTLEPVPLKDEVDALASTAMYALECADLAEGERLLEEAKSLIGGLTADRAEMEELLLEAQVMLLQVKGDYPEARGVRHEILERKRKRLGPDHLEVAEALMDTVYAQGGFYLGSAEREAMILEAHNIRKKHRADGDPLVAETTLRLAEIHSIRGRFKEAEAILRRQLDAMPNPLPAPLWRWREGMSGHLAALLMGRNNLDGAMVICREQLAFARSNFQPGHDQIGISLTRLGGVLLRRGELDEAETVIREQLALWERRYGMASVQYQSSIYRLAEILWSRQEFGEADAMLRGVIEQIEAQAGARNPRLAPFLSQRARLKEAQGDFVEAIALRRRVVALIEGAENAQEDMTQVQLGLARALIKGNQFEEAGTILVSAWDAESASDSFRYQRRRDILHALVELHGAWTKKDHSQAGHAARWQKALDEFDAAQAHREAAFVKS